MGFCLGMSIAVACWLDGHWWWDAEVVSPSASANIVDDL